jgi:hypothetical protein
MDEKLAQHNALIKSRTKSSSKKKHWRYFYPLLLFQPSPKTIQRYRILIPGTIKAIFTMRMPAFNTVFQQQKPMLNIQQRASLRPQLRKEQQRYSRLRQYLRHFLLRPAARHRQQIRLLQQTILTM